MISPQFCAPELTACYLREYTYIGVIVLATVPWPHLQPPKTCVCDEAYASPKTW